MTNIDQTGMRWIKKWAPDQNDERTERFPSTFDQSHRPWKHSDGVSQTSVFYQSAAGHWTLCVLWSDLLSTMWSFVTRVTDDIVVTYLADKVSSVFVVRPWMDACHSPTATARKTDTSHIFAGGSVCVVCVVVVCVCLCSHMCTVHKATEVRLAVSEEIKAPNTEGLLRPSYSF